MNYSPSLYNYRRFFYPFVRRIYTSRGLPPRLHNLVTTKQADKQNIANLEKNLAEEKKQRNSLVSQLQSLKKSCKKNEEAKLVFRIEIFNIVEKDFIRFFFFLLETNARNVVKIEEQH